MGGDSKTTTRKHQHSTTSLIKSIASEYSKGGVSTYLIVRDSLISPGFNYKDNIERAG